MPRTAPVPGSTLATPTCSSLSLKPSGRPLITPCSAASITFGSNVVFTVSPPPSICSSVKNSPLLSFVRSSSLRTIVSRWPFWPPYVLSGGMFGNLGSFFAACSASSRLILSMSAMPSSTYS